ncbi:discoidin domain-containing protein, partial [Clostridium perfringens]
FTNEVEIELEELTTLDRIVYTAPRGSNRGFAEAFDIYASRTTKGDNYQKVTSGNANITQNSVEIKFNPTEFKRIKFVFKKGYENWACASEFGLYKEDKTSDKVDKLFTNGLMNELSEDFNTEEKLASLEEE